MFVKDLLIDPATRDATDVEHEIVAVSSSASADKAKKFVADFKCPPSTRAYGSYEELVADPNVECIYVATPHSHHYQNTMLCLNAGKHVLCEKAFTVNEAQARKLVETAKAKKLFLMEAVWTRYFPLSIRIRELLAAGTIGPVHRVCADLSVGDDVEKKYAVDGRILGPALAGGALLDLGVYSLTWVFQCLYHALPPQERAPPTRVAAIMAPHSRTGVDETTAALLSFARGPAGAGYAQGVATTSLRLASDPDGAAGKLGVPAVRIYGAKGEVQVMHPAFRPTKYRVIVRKGEGQAPEVTEEEVPQPGGAHGFVWEADEVGRCLRDGKLESEGLGWEESCVIMGVMDEVRHPHSDFLILSTSLIGAQIRKQGGIKYPENIETLDYPVDL